MNYKEIQIRILVKMIQKFDMFGYRYDVVYEPNCIIVTDYTRDWVFKIADCDYNKSNVIVMKRDKYIGTATFEDSDVVRCAIYTIHEIRDVMDTYKGVYPIGTTLEQIMEGANR